MDDDPFSLLGVEPRFDLDAADVRMRLVRMSASLHPDRAADPIQAQECSARLAALNAAGRILENDEQRAEALLRVLGGPSAHEDRSLPDGFLQDILATRMELEEVLQSDDEAGLARMESWAHEQRQEYLQRVGALFGENPAKATPEDLLRIRTTLNTWRYIERMIEQLHPSPDTGLEGLD